MTSESVSVSAPVDIESTAKHLVASTDDLNLERFYHGTRTELRPGDLIGPSNAPDVGERDRMATYAYLTPNLDEAIWEAELAVGEGPGRVYVVEPIGQIGDASDLTDRKPLGHHRCHVVPESRCESWARSRSGVFTMALALT